MAHFPSVFQWCGRLEVISSVCFVNSLGLFPWKSTRVAVPVAVVWLMWGETAPRIQESDSCHSSNLCHRYMAPRPLRLRLLLLSGFEGSLLQYLTLAFWQDSGFFSCVPSLLFSSTHRIFLSCPFSWIFIRPRSFDREGWKGRAKPSDPSTLCDGRREHCGRALGGGRESEMRVKLSAAMQVGTIARKEPFVS